MSDIFTPVGASGVITFNGDSTEVSIENTGATAFYIVNPESNPVVVNIGFTDGAVDAIFPTSDFNGEGVVIGANSSLIYALPGKNWSAGPVWISVSGYTALASGSVYITPGVAN